MTAERPQRAFQRDPLVAPDHGELVLVDALELVGGPSRPPGHPLPVHPEVVGDVQDVGRRTPAELWVPGRAGELAEDRSVRLGQASRLSISCSSERAHS